MVEVTNAETTDAQDETDPLNDALSVGDTFEWTTGAPGVCEILEIWVDESLQTQIKVETQWSYGDVETNTVTPQDFDNVLGGALERLDD